MPNPTNTSLDERALTEAAKGDWTRDEYGRSNSSPEFHALVRAVADLIRGDAASLIAGRADATAALIMAQLAHRHGLAPRPPEPPLDEWLKEVQRQNAEDTKRTQEAMGQHSAQGQAAAAAALNSRKLERLERVLNALAEHRKEGQHG